MLSLLKMFVKCIFINFKNIVFSMRRIQAGIVKGEKAKPITAAFRLFLIPRLPPHWC
jgi:hypothetical protein